MRKLIVSVAAAGAVLAFATPAAAQYYPQPQPYGQPYGYGAPYGNAYGYNNYGQVRSLQVRVDAIQRQIRMLDRRNVIRDNSADRLRRDANAIERRLRSAARNGLNPYEANDIQRRLAVLEQRVQYATASRYGRGYNNYGYNGSYDRDRDGRDDRYENDRGTNHDD